MMKLSPSRRQFLEFSGVAVVSAFCSPLLALDVADIKTKPIPGSGEPLPVIGMGTWRTFNVGSDSRLLDRRKRLVRKFFELGGGLIDSSPMYGSAPDVMGYALGKLGVNKSLFSAEKVWSPAGGTSREQFSSLARRWGLTKFDLLQVHNLRDWQERLPVLRELKAEGKIRYLGITTSHGRRHQDVERILSSEAIDFVQLTYNITNREAESQLLPLAKDRGVAVIANRPYDGGPLIKELKRKASIPVWARQDFACQNWADFLLRFIVSHPAVTCAIPATTKLEHLSENMLAGYGPMPSLANRQKMIRYVEAL